jgi:hypothetical protein
MADDVDDDVDKDRQAKSEPTVAITSITLPSGIRETHNQK